MGFKNVGKGTKKAFDKYWDKFMEAIKFYAVAFPPKYEDFKVGLIFQKLADHFGRSWQFVKTLFGQGSEIKVRMRVCNSLGEKRLFML